MIAVHNYEKQTKKGKNKMMKMKGIRGLLFKETTNGKIFLSDELKKVEQLQHITTNKQKRQKYILVYVKDYARFRPKKKNKGDTIVSDRPITLKKKKNNSITPLEKKEEKKGETT